MSDGDFWDGDDSELTFCDHCEKTRRCTLDVDPCVRDIYPEEHYKNSWWCFQCYNDRAEEHERQNKENDK